MKKLLRIGSDILLLGLILICVLPFVYMLLMSFRSTVNAYDFRFGISNLTIEQYLRIRCLCGTFSTVSMWLEQG